MQQKVKNITIVSLSCGILGEEFVKHELEIGVKRLENYGIKVRFAKHALAGSEFIKNHPEKRAEDLLNALQSDADMILCAVGGDDTYRLLPYLFDQNELQKVACDKIFLGFSDTTMNHFMLHKVGMKTFYGQAFLPDICELDKEMLPYTKRYFEELITTGGIAQITPADVWHESRTDFSVSSIGIAMPKHKNSGFELLQGASTFSGEILGGCIDTIFDMFDGTRYTDSPEMCKRYELFPTLKDWQGKILLLESSEEKATPKKYRDIIKAIRATGIFNVINGVLMGKPADEKYFAEYKQILLEEINNSALPIVANVNVGHATPRCIIPFGVTSTVNTDAQTISFDY